MHVIMCVVGHGVVSQNVKKHGGGMMKLIRPSKKKDDFGKSGRRLEIKKGILKQKKKAKSAVYASRKRAQDKFGDLKSNY